MEECRPDRWCVWVLALTPLTKTPRSRMPEMLEPQSFLHADSDQKCGRADDDVLQMHECEMRESVGVRGFTSALLTLLHRWREG